MKHDFLFALFVFCLDYHSGQWSRGYRLSCRLQGPHYRIKLNDRDYTRIRNGSDEWLDAHDYYNQLVKKYAHKI